MGLVCILHKTANLVDEWINFPDIKRNYKKISLINLLCRQVILHQITHSFLQRKHFFIKSGLK